MVVYVSSWDGMACVFDPVIKYVCSNFISSIDSKCNAQRNHRKPLIQTSSWTGMGWLMCLTIQNVMHTAKPREAFDLL